MLTLYSFVICGLIAFANCRSITTRDVHSLDTWSPSDMSRDDWYRCHGMACDQYERMKEKLMVLKVAAVLEHEENETMDMDTMMGNMDKMMQKYNIPPDDDLDGCIWLTEEQVDEFLLDKGMRMRKKRQVESRVASGAYARWPLPIQYKFDGEHSANEQNQIRSGVRHIEEETCIRFDELGMNDVTDDNHIIVTRRATGCHSYVGRIGVKEQQLNLQAGCISTFGIPVHEFTHALGVWHEMQRSDRDEHINVLWDNIRAYRSQFSIRRSAVDLGIEYDTGSLMHYAGVDGASGGLNSMETKNALYQRNMGQRTGLSFKDAKVLNTIYCSDKCRNVLPQPCQRGGYQDPNSCNQCKCPPGFSGTYCEQLAPSTGNCGGLYQLSTDGSSVTIQSPGYDSPRYYDTDTECNWSFQAPAGYKVALRFVDDFGVYCSYKRACFHWVEVQYEANRNTQGPRFCCNDAPRDDIMSEWAEMTVLFRSNYRANSYYRRGFRAVVHAVRDPDQSTPTTTTTPTTTPTTTSTTAGPRTTKMTEMMEGERDYSWTCNFEDSSGAASWCDLTQATSDDFDWSMGRGPTPSTPTGPDSAYNGQYYIFIEATGKRNGDQAMIKLPQVPSTSDYCLSFAYSMFGFHIDTLSVAKETPNGERSNQWVRSGNQTNVWHTAEVDMGLNENDRAVFIGRRGKAYSGDIAVDALQLKTGRCSTK